MDLDDKGFRYFIPVNVNDDFNLLGVWTNPNMEGTKTIYILKKLQIIMKSTRIRDSSMKT